MRRGLSLYVLLLLFVSVAGAADEKCIRSTRYWGGDGPAEQLVVVNDHAFFGGSTLRVAELVDPTDPSVVHEVRLAGNAIDVEAHGNRIYVVDGSDELTVIDAAVPTHAAIEDRFWPDEEGWRLYELAFNGDMGIVSGETNQTGPLTKLWVVDLSGPDPKPPVLGSVYIHGHVVSLALGIRVAVAATDDDRLFFIDVSDPTAPVVTDEKDSSYLVGAARVTDLAAAGDLLAVADNAGKVAVADITTPGDVFFRGLVRNLEIGFGTLGFDGSTIHVAGATCTNAGVCGGYAVISLPAVGAPALVGRMDGPGMASPVGYGDNALTAGLEAGLRVIDLGSPAEPELLDAMLPIREVGGMASAGPLVAVIDTTTFLLPQEPDRNTLRVVKRSPDGSLGEVSSYSPEGEIWAVEAGDGFVAAAIYDEAIEFHSVEVLDVTDPSMPVVGTRLGAEISVEHETLQPHFESLGNRLYFSHKDENEILIHEVAAGTASQLSAYLPGGQLVDFAVPSKDVLAVAVRMGETNWIEVVDTRDPSSPFVAGAFAIPEPADAALMLDAEGRRVAVLCRDLDGFEGRPYTYSMIVDVSDPSNPTLALDNLLGGDWLALGVGILHTQAYTQPWSPQIQRHSPIELTDPDNWFSFDNIGPLDVPANRVDADGRYFNVSRNGRLEVYDYGVCGPVAAVPFSRSYAD